MTAYGFVSIIPEDAKVPCICGTPIYWQSCPTGGWWIHVNRNLDGNGVIDPKDGRHDGEPEDPHVPVYVEEPCVGGYNCYNSCYTCGCEWPYCKVKNPNAPYFQTPPV